MSSPLVCIGHRGAKGHAPENTVLSVETAIALGASWVEIDVYFVDGHLIVFHDQRLERTTNGSGCLEQRTFDYLRSLDAGRGQRIPTLEEVFAVAKGRVGVNVELKRTGTVAPVAALVKEQVGQGWDYGQILVSSADRRSLERIKGLAPELLTGALVQGTDVEDTAFAQRIGCYSVHPALEVVTRRLVDDAHARALKVFVYTVNEPGEIGRMASLGVDGVITDYPERVPPAQGRAGRPG